MWQFCMVYSCTRPIKKRKKIIHMDHWGKAEHVSLGKISCTDKWFMVLIRDGSMVVMLEIPLPFRMSPELRNVHCISMVSLNMTEGTTRPAF